MNELAIQPYSNNGESDSGFISLIKNWCYKQLLGQFPLQGEGILLDFWTEIKKYLIIYGRCATVWLGEDVVVAKVEKVNRNLSKRIISIEVSLSDGGNSKLVLFSKIGQEIQRKRIEVLKNKKENFISRVFSSRNQEIENLEKELLKGSRTFVLWQNNCEETSDMKYVDPLLNDLKIIRENMIWDRKKSRKQVVVPMPRKPEPQIWTKVVNSLEQDYVCALTLDDETKLEYKIENPDSKQKDLWEDFQKTFDFLRRMLGIEHNTSKKKERHNIPEMEIMESQFLAFKQEKRELLEKGIREFEENFSGNYELGSLDWVEEKKENSEEQEILKKTK